jgi:hypothetical protein
MNIPALWEEITATAKELSIGRGIPFDEAIREVMAGFEIVCAKHKNSQPDTAT